MMNIPEPQNLPTLYGKRVKLRPPVERDKQDRFAAGRDPEFRRMVGGDPADRPPLNGTPFKIIGVAPKEFQGVLAGYPNDVWIPMMLLRLGYRGCDALTDFSCTPLGFIGRLAPDRTLENAQTELTALSIQLLERVLVVNDQPYQVVGVFKDAQLRNALEAPLPFLYLPYWQNNFRPQAEGDKSGSNGCAQA
jgi:hypothetical protein